MPAESIKYFAEVIEKEMGINFFQGNMYQLESRLNDIAVKENLTIPELAKVFKEGIHSQLRQRIFDEATNNETLFFRDPTYFAAIGEFVRLKILPKAPRSIKIWSAACSTGQEPISLAITLEELSKKMAFPPFTILATDISEKALTKARNGVYSDFEVMRGLSDERKLRYFEKVTDGWKVRGDISSKITYQSNNLTRSTVKDSFHLILCRNVLIYHKIDVKRAVVESLFSNLEDDGALLLGVGETLLGVIDNPALFPINNVSFYSRKKTN